MRAAITDCTVSGISDFADLTGEFVAAGADAQRPAFHQRSDGLLDEQRRSAGALDDERAQLRIVRIVAQQGPNQLVGSVGFERIEMDCGEAVLAAPSVARSPAGTSKSPANGWPPCCPPGFRPRPASRRRSIACPRTRAEADDFERSAGTGPSRSTSFVAGAPRARASANRHPRREARAAIAVPEHRSTSLPAMRREPHAGGASLRREKPARESRTRTRSRLEMAR